jgi:GDP-L-fucose synthase
MSYDRKRVLVTGGAGFIGTHLIGKLLNAGARVRATLHATPATVSDPRVEYVTGDLMDAGMCRAACDGMELVFLCAASTSGAAAIQSTPLVHLTPNIVMNARMLDAAYVAGVRKLLFISSSIVYPVSDDPVKEGDVTGDFFEKYHVAAWMKRFTETMCDIYTARIARPMPCVVVRPANAYGPHDKFDPDRSHVLPALIRKVVERLDPLPVWGDGMDLKDFIYIDDLVEGMLLAMEKLDGTQPVNLASGQAYRLRDLLQMILRLDGYDDARIAYDTSKPTMIPRRLIDPSLAKALLGFEATTPIEEGLRRTIAWYRQSLAARARAAMPARACGVRP